MVLMEFRVAKVFRAWWGIRECRVLRVIKALKE
jgi:hypothetical protein